MKPTAPRSRGALGAFPLAVLLSLAPAASALADENPPWPDDLALAGGGWWRARIAVTITGRASRALEPVTISFPVAPSPAGAPLEGARVGELRVASADGRELLWRLTARDGSPLGSGTIPPGARLSFVAEPSSEGSRTCYLYFENPAAWPVRELLPAGRGAPPAASGRISIRCGPVERRELTIEKGSTAWSDAPADATVGLTVRLLGGGAAPVPSRIFRANLSPALRYRAGAAGLRLLTGAIADRERIDGCVLDDTLLLVASCPPRTARERRLWLAPLEGDAAAAERAAERRLARWMRSPANLVADPGFESGEPSGGAWSPRDGGRSPPGVEKGFTAPGRWGRRAARIRVGEGTPPGWRGWHQTVAIQGGVPLLYGGWVRCEEVRGGDVRLHAHMLDAAGRLTKEGGLQSVGAGLTGTTGWTRVLGLLHPPRDAASVSLHLTMNGSGTLEHDGIFLFPVGAASLVKVEPRPRGPLPPLAAWSVDPIVKVFREDLPLRLEAIGAPVRIEAARGEQEPLQLALRAPRQLGTVRIEAEQPRGPAGALLPAPRVEIVGYVPVDRASNYYRSDAPEYIRARPRRAPGADGWAGWWPDPLIARDTVELEANRTQPVWITYRVPRSARPGLYHAAVRLAGEGGARAEVDVTVRVHSFELPEHLELKAIYDVRFRRPWGTAPDWRARAREEVLGLLATHRLSQDAVRPDPRFRCRGGEASADFTLYDRASRHAFEELGMPHSYTPHVFYCFGWGYPPRPFLGEAPYEGKPPYPGVDRSRLRPAYRRSYQACLDLFWHHVKEKGWADRFVLYISDEPHYWQGPEIVAQMRALCRMIHEVDPAIPIYSSTWSVVPEWIGDLDIWGLGHYGRVAPEQLRELRARGARIWFTTDGQLCLDTPYCAIERLLPWYCHRWGAEAYEFWGVSWHTYDPWEAGWHSFISQSDRPGNHYRVRYPNGDGYLIYPPRAGVSERAASTVRLEEAREGMEDFAYLRLLERLIGEAEKAGRDAGAARAALAEAASLAPIPAPQGRYSSRILPDPSRLAAVRHRIADAIEELSGAARAGALRGPGSEK